MKAKNNTSSPFPSQGLKRENKIKKKKKKKKKKDTVLQFITEDESKTNTNAAYKYSEHKLFIIDKKK